ncbi:MAG: serine hydrolase [Tistlia sp.]|uniref:serine hydrolase n=1 Tax=Tistlia sp. TaxID=3057121 RepID=UPI0034A4266B
MPTPAPRPGSNVLAACLLVAAGLFPAGLFAAAPADAAEPLPPPQTPGVAVPAGQAEWAVAQLDGLVAELLERSGLPGLAVAVVHRGETVYAKGFGLRRRGEPAAVDADTVFQLASVSKSIGATVVAQQLAAGVDWETPVSQHLPWFTLADAWVGRSVTIGDLYGHRSGLPEHAGDDLEDLGYGRHEVLERLHLLPLHPFRAHYAYTNFGLTAAAEAVAAAAGLDWATLSERSLYRPLGMTATSSRFADFEARENRAHGHVLGPEGYAPLHQRQPDAQSPAGGVSASVRDVAKWMALVLANGRHEGRPLIAPKALLPAITAQSVASPSYAADARPSFYGFGFNVAVQPSGRTSLGHSGAFALGAATNFLMIPSLDLGIAVLSNAAPIGAVEALAASFADLAQFGKVTRDWLPAYGARMEQMTAPVGSLVGQPRPASPKPARPRSAFVGRYANAYFGEAVVEQRGETLVLLLGPERRAHALTHWDGDTFTYVPFGENAPAGSLSSVAFAGAGIGRATAVTVEFLDKNGLGTFSRQ